MRKAAPILSGEMFPTFIRVARNKAILACFLCGVVLACGTDVPTVPRSFDLAGRWRLFVNGDPSPLSPLWVSNDELHMVVEMPDETLLFLSLNKTRALALDDSVNVDLSEDGEHLVVELPLTSDSAFPILFEGTTIRFPWRRQVVEVRRNPAVVGRVACEHLLGQLPEMGRVRRAYQTDEAELERLHKLLDGQSRELEILFGQWCPISREVVPRILAVTDRLGDKARVRCVGIPAPVAKDRYARSLGIQEVPALLDTSDPDQIIFANDLKRVERALLDLWGDRDGLGVREASSPRLIAD